MRLSPLFILPLLVTTWQTAFAVTIDDCSKITTDAERLACFDSVYKTDNDTKHDDSKKNWHLVEDHSKLDDSVSYILIAISDEKVDETEGLGGYGSIGIACSKNTTRILFQAGNQYLSDTGKYSRVSYRLDKEKFEKISMDVSEDGDALGLWSGAVSIPLIKKMFSHEKMVVEITPYRKTPVTMEFSISGLEEAIKPLRQACKW
ncbi:MAG: hypothetical protein [Bacteriophage sp.]|nr:MAG: hypothetical protein [Bacteriophage sp.]